MIGGTEGKLLTRLRGIPIVLSLVDVYFEATDTAYTLHPLIHLTLAVGHQIVGPLRRPHVKHVLIVLFTALEL
jgi:hypothetical protein